jgi:photosystem II stability/assembly factor-like uncharacterized protein
VSAETWWVVGSGGKILRTDDAGASWTDQSFGTDQLRAVSAVSTDVVWAAGTNGTVLRSTDGGRSWTTLGTGAGSTVTGISALSASTAWATQGWQGIRFTTNGGASWTQQTDPAGEHEQSVTALDTHTAFVGNGRGMLRTLDAGATWSYVVSSWNDTYALGVIDASSAISGNVLGDINRLAAGPAISDYVAGSTNWAATAGVNSTMFGACLQAVGASTTADWTKETANGTCDATDADPWHAIPTSPVKIAHTTTAGQAGQVDLVWGVRAGQNLASGTYAATITFEALAPNV